jgi:phosphoribosylanthranilate isomerase
LGLEDLLKKKQIDGLQLHSNEKKDLLQQLIGVSWGP